MAVYVVTWNINKAGAAYQSARDAFIKQIENYDHKRDPSLETVRFLSTTSSPDQVSAYLRQELDDNDRLLVSKMNRNEHQGWLDKGTWDWINARL